MNKFDLIVGLVMLLMVGQAFGGAEIVSSRGFPYLIVYNPEAIGEELTVTKDGALIGTQEVGRPYLNDELSLQNSSIFFDKQKDELVFVEWNKVGNKLDIHGKNFLVNPEGHFFNDFDDSIQIDHTFSPWPVSKDAFKKALARYELSGSILDQLFNKLR